MPAAISAAGAANVAGPVHRRSFVEHTPPLAPTFTNLAPCAAGTPPTLLLAADSTATYIPPSGRERPLPPPLQPDPLSALALTPDASLALLAHRSGNVRLHDLPPGPAPPRALRPFRDANVVAFIAVHPSGRYAAFAAADGAIRVHDLQSLAVTHSLAAGAALTALAFPPAGDATALLAGCDDGAIRMFDLREKSSEPVAAVRPHVARVSALVFVDDGTLVSVSPDATLAIITVGPRKLVQSNLLVAKEPLSVAAPLSDGRVVVAAPRGKLRIGNISTRTECASESLQIPFVTAAQDANQGSDDDDEADAIAIANVVSAAPDKLLVALSDQTLLHIAAPPTGKLSVLPEARCGNLEEVYDVAVLPGLLAIASNSETVWLAEVPSAEDKTPWRPVAALPGHGANVLALNAAPVPASSPYCAADFVLASASRDHVARVWARANGSKRWRAAAIAEGHADAVSAIALSPKLIAGQTFLVTGGADKTLKLWSLDNALKAICKRMGQDDNDESLNSTFHVAETNGTPELSAKWTVLAHEKDINAVAVSPDGKVIATGSQDRTLKLWTADKGVAHATCTGHRRGIWSVAFSTVDRIVASASGDATIRVWNVSNGNCLRTLQGHLGGVLRAMFVSRGTQIASSGADGLVKIWTTKSGECDATLDGHEDRVWALDVTEDGGQVISGGADGKVRVWTDDTVNQERAAAKKRDEEAVMEQVVDNAARSKKWTVAAKGALELNMTHKLKNIMNSLLVSSEDPDETLQEMISGLLQEEGTDGDEVMENDEDKEEKEKEKWKLVGRLFVCCRDWNASGGAKSAAVASHVLRALFSMWTAETLCDKLPMEKRPLVEALEAHCARHVERVNELVMKSCVLEYTLSSMQGLSAVTEEQMEDVTPAEQVVAAKVAKKHARKIANAKQNGSATATDSKGTRTTNRKRKPRGELDDDY